MKNYPFGITDESVFKFSWFFKKYNIIYL
jgi:hypothetical protein